LIFNLNGVKFILEGGIHMLRGIELERFAGLGEERRTQFEDRSRRIIQHLTEQLLRAGAIHKENHEPCQPGATEERPCVNPMHLSIP
jgi:hypothetical protein